MILNRYSRHCVKTIRYDLNLRGVDTLVTVNGNKSVCAGCVDKNTIFTRVILHLYRKLRHTEREGGGGREKRRDRERQQHERERGQKKNILT